MPVGLVHSQQTHFEQSVHLSKPSHWNFTGKEISQKYILHRIKSSYLALSLTSRHRLLAKRMEFVAEEACRRVVVTLHHKQHCIFLNGWKFLHTDSTAPAIYFAFSPPRLVYSISPLYFVHWHRHTHAGLNSSANLTKSLVQTRPLSHRDGFGFCQHYVARDFETAPRSTHWICFGSNWCASCSQAGWKPRFEKSMKAPMENVKRALTNRLKLKKKSLRRKRKNGKTTV